MTTHVRSYTVYVWTANSLNFLCYTLLSISLVQFTLSHLIGTSGMSCNISVSIIHTWRTLIGVLVSISWTSACWPWALSICRTLIIQTTRLTKAFPCSTQHKWTTNSITEDAYIPVSEPQTVLLKMLIYR